MAFGFTTSSDAPCLARIDSVVSESARRAGLRPNDLVLSVAGHRLGLGASDVELVKHIPAAGSATLVLQVQGSVGPVRRVTLSRDRKGWWRNVTRDGNLPGAVMGTYYFLSALVVGLLMTIAPLILLMKMSHDTEALLLGVGLALFGATGIFAGQWVALTFGFPGPVLGILLTLSWSVIIVALSAFPDGRFRSPVEQCVPIAAVLLGVAFITLFALQRIQYDANNNTFFLPEAILFLIASAELVRLYTKAERGPEKAAHKMGCLRIFPLVMHRNHLHPVDNPWFPGPHERWTVCDHCRADRWFLGIYLAAAWINPVDHETPAVRCRKCITKAATGTILLGISWFLFHTFDKMIEISTESLFNEHVRVIAWPLLVAISVAIFLLFDDKVSHAINHRFRGGLEALKTTLPHYLRDARELRSPREIADHVLEQIAAGTRTRHAALIVDDEVLAARDISDAAVLQWYEAWEPTHDHAVECDRDDPHFPMRLPLQAPGFPHRGWLIVGPRPDNSLLDRDERQALAVIADPIRWALEISRKRERVSHMERLMADFESQLDAVKRALAALPVADRANFLQQIMRLLGITWRVPRRGNDGAQRPAPGFDTRPQGTYQDNGFPSQI